MHSVLAWWLCRTLSTEKRKRGSAQARSRQRVGAVGQRKVGGDRTDFVGTVGEDNCHHIFEILGHACIFMLMVIEQAEPPNDFFLTFPC